MKIIFSNFIALLQKAAKLLLQKAALLQKTAKMLLRKAALLQKAALLRKAALQEFLIMVFGTL